MVGPEMVDKIEKKGLLKPCAQYDKREGTMGGPERTLQFGLENGDPPVFGEGAVDGNIDCDRILLVFPRAGSVRACRGILSSSSHARAGATEESGRQIGRYWAIERQGEGTGGTCGGTNVTKVAEGLDKMWVNEDEMWDF